MPFVLTVLFLCIPVSALAAVTISEVAWMGSVDSANHEWIELYNYGGAVDVTGWTLTDGMNLSIALSGTIAGGSYAVLERTSDASAAGTAFLIYSGAFVNTGATLTLKRADGGIEDQVAGGENWQSIGGDNATKETAQYTATGWVTGTATPGAANAGTAPVIEEREEEEAEIVEEPKQKTNSDSGKSGASETVKLVLTDAMLALSIDAQTKGYVNQPIRFEAIPSGVGKTITNSLAYQWNFGDGGVTYGSTPTHTFSYPGTYVVTVYGSYKRQKQLARHEITILPVSLSVTKNSYGDIQINNDSPYEIDVSEYVVEGEKRWRFPEYSIILPKQTVTLKKSKIGTGMIRIFDAERKVVAVSGGVNSEATIPSSPPLVFKSATLPKPVPQVAGASTSTVPEEVPFVSPSEATTSPSKIPPNALPYLGLIMVILLGLVGTAAKIGRNQSG